MITSTPESTSTRSRHVDAVLSPIPQYGYQYTGHLNSAKEKQPAVEHASSSGSTSPSGSAQVHERNPASRDEPPNHQASSGAATGANPTVQTKGDGPPGAHGAPNTSRTHVVPDPVPIRPPSQHNNRAQVDVSDENQPVTRPYQKNNLRVRTGAPSSRRRPSPNPGPSFIPGGEGSSAGNPSSQSTILEVTTYDPMAPIIENSQSRHRTAQPQHTDIPAPPPWPQRDPAEDDWAYFDPDDQHEGERRGARSRYCSVRRLLKRIRCAILPCTDTASEEPLESERPIAASEESLSPVSNASSGTSSASRRHGQAQAQPSHIPPGVQPPHIMGNLPWYPQYGGFTSCHQCRTFAGHQLGCPVYTTSRYHCAYVTQNYTQSHRHPSKTTASRGMQTEEPSRDRHNRPPKEGTRDSTNLSRRQTAEVGVTAAWAPSPAPIPPTQHAAGQRKTPESENDTPSPVTPLSMPPPIIPPIIPSGNVPLATMIHPPRRRHQGTSKAAIPDSPPAVIPPRIHDPPRRRVVPPNTAPDRPNKQLDTPPPSRRPTPSRDSIPPNPVRGPTPHRGGFGFIQPVPHMWAQPFITAGLPLMLPSIPWVPHPRPHPSIPAAAFWQLPYPVSRSHTPAVMHMTGGYPLPGTMPGAWQTPAWPPNAPLVPVLPEGAGTTELVPDPHGARPIVCPILIPNPGNASVPWLDWDMRMPPSLAKRITARKVVMPHIDDRRGDAATHPPTPRLAIAYHTAAPGLPTRWGPIVVDKGAGGTVTVGDVVDAVFAFFQTPLTHDDGIDLRRRHPAEWMSMKRAFMKRCRDYPAIPAKTHEDGMFRVDALAERYKWWGMWVQWNADGSWYLNLGTIPKRMPMPR